MALNRLEKRHIVEQVAQQANSAVSMLVAEYSGMTVQQMTTLRNQSVKAGVSIRVVKNTLSRQALKDTSHACLSAALQGPLVLAFAKDGPGDAARVFLEMMKTSQTLKVTALSLGGKILDGSQAKVVASLPTHDEALAQLIGTIQAPITNLVQTVNAIPSKLVRTVDAVRVAKQAA